MKHLILLALSLAVIAQGAPTTVYSDFHKRHFATGLLKHPKPDLSPVPKDLQDAPVPGKFHLKDMAAKLGVSLTGIYDQGQCGSCVYNSVSKNAGDSLRLRGVKNDALSRQWLMDCGAREWMCDGSIFEIPAKDLASKGGQPNESDYAYQARNQSCKGTPSQLFGPFKGYKIIDGTPQSIAAWLVKGYPVSVTVGADNSWVNYHGGTYTACTRAQTNHEVLIYGYDCETSVDSNGHCLFNDRGYPKNGDGYAVVVNSWGERWGETGEMKSRWLGRNGRKCNNLAEEAGILETGLPDPMPGPGPGPGPGPTELTCKCSSCQSVADPNYPLACKCSSCR